MSYKTSQLFPPMVTRVAQREIFVQPPSSDIPQHSSYTQFWRAWLEPNRGLDNSRRTAPSMKWRTVFAIAGTVVVGAGFWTALGFFVARIWK
jgi:hypothetical protein